MRTKFALGLTSLAAVMLVMIVTTQLGYVQTGDSVDIKATSSNIPRPPPTPLSSLGVKASSFTDAKTITGLANAQLPSYVPNDLVLESVRASKTDTDSRMYVIYQPKGITTNEDNIAQRLMDAGIVIEVIKEPTNSKFDWNAYVNQQVREAPEVRSSVTINGKQIMLLKNNQEFDLPYTARTIVGDQQISVYSKIIDTPELTRVISSMLTN